MGVARPATDPRNPSGGPHRRRSETGETAGPDRHGLMVVHDWAVVNGLSSPHPCWPPRAGRIGGTQPAWTRGVRHVLRDGCEDLRTLRLRLAKTALHSRHGAPPRQGKSGLRLRQARRTGLIIPPRHSRRGVEGGGQFRPDPPRSCCPAGSARNPRAAPRLPRSCRARSACPFPSGLRGGVRTGARRRTRRSRRRAGARDR